MKQLRYTLVTDGPTDRVLLHPIRWLLTSLCDCETLGAWADPYVCLRGAEEHTLAARVQAALEYYPCDLLLIHRDAETATRSARVDEITAAVKGCTPLPPAVCVVPIRMTEAWLLSDENAIRCASSNPNGRIALALPDAHTIESIPNPKKLLHDLLKTATELSGRRLRMFKVGKAVHRVAEHTTDYSPLLSLDAFRTFRDELEMIVQEHGWAPQNQDVR